MFLIGALQIHSALSIVGKHKQKKKFIIFLYVTAILLTIFFLIEPDFFLLPSVSKMYFPNYYVPGSLNIVRLLFMDGIGLTYSIYLILKASNQATSDTEKKRYLYISLTIATVYAILMIPNFLVYNIEIDPLWGMLVGPVALMPFLYGAMKYEILNIKIIAKQAFFFALAVAGVGGIITIFNYSNIWLQQILPAFPLWVTAFVSSILTVTLSVFVWRSLRKNDLLRYEFITTVTHKFRTPLTHIKWSAENLSKLRMSQEANGELDNIVSANSKLVELTNLLVNASELEQSSFAYKKERVDFSRVVKETVGAMSRQMQVKNIVLSTDFTPSITVFCDVSRIQFVVQTLIENAINYNTQGGHITLKSNVVNGSVIFSVTDTGIGIPDSELSLIFSRFYRGALARSSDTEGMGIGLFMSKQIVSRHDGKIWAESAGEGKGSTFSFSIPVA